MAPHAHYPYPAGQLAGEAIADRSCLQARLDAFRLVRVVGERVRPELLPDGPAPAEHGAVRVARRLVGAVPFPSAQHGCRRPAWHERETLRREGRQGWLHEMGGWRVVAGQEVSQPVDAVLRAAAVGVV